MDIDAARAALAEEREQVERRALALRRDVERIMASSRDVATDDEHDPEGTTAFERAQTQALLDAAVLGLAEVDAALARLAAGSYGRCEGCGGAISPDRLAARPVARTCIACAPTRR
jgi:DnaK suppressor protein